MKYIFILILGIAVGAGGFLFFAGNTSNLGGSGSVNYSTLKSGNASSTIMTIGPDISSQILAERSLRNAWSACYSTKAGSGTIYLVLTDSAVIGTTTGVLAELESGECYFSERETVYAGIVHAIGLTASSTNLFVTETFNSN